MSDDRSEMEATRLAGLEQRHEQRLARATYTAAEVKVLTETALRLGRKEAGEEIADAIEATRIPSTEDNSWLLHAAKIARSIASQPSGAVSDEPAGVPGHQEVSEAARSPQEPCGHPDCPCVQMHSHPEGSTP